MNTAIESESSEQHCWDGSGLARCLPFRHYEDMGLLVDYFVAPSDADAEQVTAVGPAGRFPMIDGYGVEPTVRLGQFQEMLTGKTFDQQLDDPESYPVIASTNNGHIVVIRLESGFLSALATADTDTLTDLAEPWSEIEEFDGGSEPDELAEFLVALRGLASSALESGGGLYCWVSV